MYTTRRVGDTLFIRFDRQISHRVRESLKAHGFKEVNGVWYGKYKRGVVEYLHNWASSKVIRYPATLCWDCGNAIGGCEWSRRFRPVPGWDAIPTEIGYCVVKCPEFVSG